MRALCIFGIAGLASCSLVTSLDGFSDPGATPDNRTTSSDGGDESETAEGANPLNDAGSGNLLPGTNAGFCKNAGAALFCIDFDDGTIPSEFKVRRSGENVVMRVGGASKL